MSNDACDSHHAMLSSSPSSSCLLFWPLASQSIWPTGKHRSPCFREEEEEEEDEDEEEEEEEEEEGGIEWRKEAVSNPQQQEAAAAEVPISVNKTLQCPLICVF